MNQTTKQPQNSKGKEKNYQKSKSAASELPDMLMDVIKAVTREDAQRIIEAIKAENYNKTQ